MNWNITQQGQGKVIKQDSSYELRLPAVDSQSYHNAQISDYDASRQFKLKPPLRLSLKARATTNQLGGTAGFGFWNHPFAPNETRLRIPQALWFFFSSPPNEMALAKGMPSHGWKAATFNAKRLPFYALLPTAPLAIPLMNIPFFYNLLWGIGQDAIGVRETHLDKNILLEEHEYSIECLPDVVKFSLDGAVILESRHAIPKNPLGFVAWLDNQYAIISPKGKFGFGLTSIAEEQSLFLEDISLTQ